MDSNMEVYDYIVIGSGFGGSVAAMRLTEKGYSVLVIEKGKRFRDEDFAKSNWAFWKYLWNPVLRSFGILQMSLLNGMLVLHGSGLGGGSLGYASVLMEPDPAVFEEAAWQSLVNWKTVLPKYYQLARHMLGVANTPRFYQADRMLEKTAKIMGRADTFTSTTVGIFFGKSGESDGKDYPDPFFGGEGPRRNSCQHCGGCMVGCRHNAKNTLVKNYLFFAEKWGAKILTESKVEKIEPIDQANARFQIEVLESTAIIKTKRIFRANNVVVAAGVMGTLNLLFQQKMGYKTLSKLSDTLGNNVRTNSEALLGATTRKFKEDYSQGVAIGSIFKADEVTNIEPVRYPSKNGLMRLLSWPLLDSDKPGWHRLLQLLWFLISRPLDFLRSMVLPRWPERSTILLVMQTLDNKLQVRRGRNAWTFFKPGLVTGSAEMKKIPTKIEMGHKVARQYAEEINGIAAGSIAESLLGMPSTAHILGGCPMGVDSTQGVIDKHCQVHNYPGLYVIDGSIMPGNPGINPSLTITALAEYALSHIPHKNQY